MGWLDKSISKQRSFIEGLSLDPLRTLADICAANWSDRHKLDLSSDDVYFIFSESQV